MPHDTPLIATLVGAFVLAFGFGAVAQRLRLSPLVGYLVAGIMVGPFTPGFVADQHLAEELAEIGIILLMFGVGLHFSLRDLLSVKAIAVPGAILQIGVATLMGMGLAHVLGWGIGGGLVFGLALSVASTVVLLRALQERRMIESEQGRIAVGWLIVEDLAMVLALVLLPALSEALGGKPAETGAAADWFGHLDVWTSIAVTLGKVAAFVVFMLVVGRRVIPFVMNWVAHIGSRELFRLAVLAVALGVAFGSAKLFGVSFALGAFFAGMVLSESPLSHRAAEETLPLRDAFAVLFFVSVGMLVDPEIIITRPLPLLATLAIVLVGKSVAAYVLVRLFGYARLTAFTISASLAQIGEFSFILVALGMSLGLLPKEGSDLILAAAIISILANPFFFLVLDRIRARKLAQDVAREVARKQEKAEAKAAKLEAKSEAMTEAEAAKATAKALAKEAKAEAKAQAKAAAKAAKAAAKAAGEATADAVEAGDTEPDLEALQVTDKEDHTILVGYGRVGRLVAEGLKAAGVPLLVIEDQEDPVEELRAGGFEVVYANAASPAAITAANVAGAKRLILAIPNGFEASGVLKKARAVNPDIEIIARAHSDEEVERLRQTGADFIIMGEREVARGMLGQVLPAASAEAKPRLEAALPPVGHGGAEGEPTQDHASEPSADATALTAAPEEAEPREKPEEVPAEKGAAPEASGGETPSAAGGGKGEVRAPQAAAANDR
ncbi:MULTISPECIES: cation:proton antiporter domain-containing protein [unclassified Xanthobacter]|uniref:cation:proton antiporter domain-containing protein n=1 Tax=unclassified Xanthobacter TaxID=2623496 RepID=UPI001F2FB6EA|nr:MULTISPECIES: cation:proton antiporter [unclassified Xanthobacter]